MYIDDTILIIVAAIIGWITQYLTFNQRIQLSELPHLQDIESVSENSVGDYFDDIEVDELFKSFVLKAGHCPRCGDFLFPEVNGSKEEGFTVVYECMNRECDYEVDVSDDFNVKLGLNESFNSVKKDLKCKNPPHVYYFPYTTGTLKASYTDASLCDKSLVFNTPEDNEYVPMSLKEKVLKKVSLNLCCVDCRNTHSFKVNYDEDNGECICVCKECGSIFDVSMFYNYFYYKLAVREGVRLSDLPESVCGFRGKRFYDCKSFKLGNVSDKSDFYDVIGRDATGRFSRGVGDVYQSRLHKDMFFDMCKFRFRIVPSFDDLKFESDSDVLYCVLDGVSGGYKVYVRVDGGFELVDLLSVNEYVDLKSCFC